MKTLPTCITIVLLATLFTLTALSQESAVKGNISGTVLDNSGAVVPGAKITLSGPTGTRTSNSDSNGGFTFGTLTPGFYSVKVEKDGFKTAELRSVEVYTGRTSSLRVNLPVGQVTETVEVSASALTVDTTSTAVGANLNDSFYTAIPAQRGVTGIFYASPGVNAGGGTGAANPSISGGTGLENQYVADGVNITDGAFGGIGVYSRVYGSLATGINLSFVKEVQVKTGGYEPQYGKSTGGVVQIVTKSGGNAYHGAFAAYFGPQEFELDRLHPDDFGRLNLAGKTLHQGAYEISGEIGGYVPGLKDNLFFFGSFNPTWNRDYDQFSTFHGVLNFPLVGRKTTLKSNSYNYAAKLTWKLNDNNQVEASLFGDPTRNDTGPWNNTATFSDTTFSKLSYGTRNLVARYNATLTPTWLFNFSASWGHNNFTETPLHPDIFGIVDLTGRGSLGSDQGPLGQLTGTYNRQGLGFVENTKGDNVALNFDTQKVAKMLGEHTVSVGYRYERNYYKGRRERTGGCYTVPQAEVQDVLDSSGFDITGQCNDGTFQLRLVSGSGVSTFVPGIGPAEVALLQTRGEFGDRNFNTRGTYHAAFVNDSWSPWKYITANIGWRWEQQFMLGTASTNFETGEPFQPHYTFTDNWSPRIGLSIDPTGNRKTKIYGNYARYNYAIPLDMAIRSFSNELDLLGNFWLPPSDASGNMIVNPDGTMAQPIFDDAHYVPGVAIGVQSTTAIAPGTKMQYLDEWVAGFEQELPKGIIVSVRYLDRRLKRIVEDMAGLSPEAYNAGLAQQYFIGNPNTGTDLFTNPVQIAFPSGGAIPVACGGATAPIVLDPVVDTFGNVISPGAVCVVPGPYANGAEPGDAISDGIADGFVNPARKYKAIEVEVNKAFSSGWQMRNNYRWSQLSGNYEGAFRNDNAQSDPSISSLFDFTAGNFGLLGDQFAIGWLNTDRRHIFNSFLSYTFGKTLLKNLTVGTGVRVESGVPVNDLKAHPAYLNAGEIPVNGRGSLGRTETTGQADLHVDYMMKMGEKIRTHFGADLFNITNQTTQLRVDQNEDRSFGVPNFDFLKPVGRGGIGIQPGFQRPFYSRFMVKLEF